MKALIRCPQDPDAGMKMNKYVKTRKIGDNLWRVKFTVGVQTFRVGCDFETKAQAVWYRKMMIKALENLVRLETKR